MREEIKQIIEKEYADLDYFDYKYHLLPVVEYAAKLAEICEVNKEVVELSAWLHDIGRIKFGARNHELTGAAEAERLLKQFGYSDEIIEQVKHCILAHRGSGSIRPQTMEAKVVAAADALAHFDMFLPLLTAIGKRGKGKDDKILYRWIYEKMERDWNKKILIPEAMEIAEEKYRAIELLLGSEASGPDNDAVAHQSEAGCL
jgi:putative nucleotidyltransferase with HDIG domain